jgi:hypothetical protein
MALSRHDMRRLNEAYYGVQAACSELSAFCRELVVPSDGTVEEVIEMLTEPAGHDLRTLQRAVGAYIDAVMSLRNYDTLFGADQHRAQQRARMLELVGEIGVFVERMLVKSKTRQFEDGAQLAALDANPTAERTRQLDSLAREAAISFGFAAGQSLQNDDGDSSSEDSDYVPDKDDDDGEGLLASLSDGGEDEIVEDDEKSDESVLNKRQRTQE